NGWEAFRWSSIEGMSGLGDLPGGEFDSHARSVSANGSIIVGRASTIGGGGTAFIWDSAHGMRSLQSVLNDLGLNMTGWRLTDALVSGDGKVFTGNGINSDGDQQAWIATLN